MSHATPAAANVTKELIEKARASYVPVYSPRDMILSHGEGSRIWDLEGAEYIDLGCGIGVNSLGHQHPALLEALQQQARKLWHTSNIYYTEPAIRLAEELIRLSFADRVFFSNSGAEANEMAIKLVRKASSLKFPKEKREILTFQGSFHGRTLATVTATAQPKYQEGFEPLPGGFVYCPFNDFDAAAQAVGGKTCAVMVEPVQGEGGIVPAKPGFLKHLRSLCDQHQALLIFDEIQCGMGRTGTLFAHQTEQVTPDIMTLAKALGGGLPIGATLTTDAAAQAFTVGNHGSTFGGNPVVAAVALTMLRQIHSTDLMAHVQKQGALLTRRLEEMHDRFGMFSEIRGKGLMIGAVLQGQWQDQAKEIMEACRLKGVLILQAGPNVLRFLPPLNISEEDLELGIQRMTSGCQAYQEAMGSASAA